MNVLIYACGAQDCMYLTLLPESTHVNYVMYMYMSMCVCVCVFTCACFIYINQHSLVCDCIITTRYKNIHVFSCFNVLYTNTNTHTHTRASIRASLVQMHTHTLLLLSNLRGNGLQHSHILEDKILHVLCMHTTYSMSC
jgi:hypothetical protein